MSRQFPALLVVFAHPDDESFHAGSTLALLADWPVAGGVAIGFLHSFLHNAL